MARIFISYSQADYDTVERIEKMIAALGHSPIKCANSKDWPSLLYELARGK